MKRGEEEVHGEPPVLLPFIRVVKEPSAGSDCPTIVRREEAEAARSLRLPRRGDQRNVQ
jgi:hypothetical protein